MKNYIDNSARCLIREEMYHDDSNEYYEDDDYRVKSSQTRLLVLMLG